MGDRERDGDPGSGRPAFIPVDVSHAPKTRKSRRSKSRPPSASGKPSSKGAPDRKKRPTPGYLRFKRRRRNRAIILGIGIVAGVILADAAWAGVVLYRSVQEAQDRLEEGTDQLIAGDIDGAVSSFAAARDAAAEADGATLHPSVFIGRLIPGLGDQVTAIRLSARAALQTTIAAGHVASAAREVGWNGETIPGFASGGRVDAARMLAAVPDLDRAASALDAATVALDEIDTDALLGPLRSRLVTAKAEVQARAEQTQDIAVATRLLASMLGATGDRRYLLVMLNTADPRGAGGYPGTFALINTDGQKVSLNRMTETSAILPLTEGIDVPPDVAKRYGRYGVTTNFIATTYSPDFPTDARLMQAMWEASGHDPVDGVIAADPDALAYLMEGLGLTDIPSPVRSGSFPDALRPDNVAMVIERDTFRTTDQETSDRWQARIGDAIWRSVLDATPSPGIGSAAAEAVEGRHVQMYSNHPAEQALIRELGADGGLVVPPDEPTVVLNGFTSTRTGSFIETEATQERVPADDDRGDKVTVTVTLTNNAPTKPPSILLGSRLSKSPPGWFGTNVDLFLPKGATQPQTRTPFASFPIIGATGGKELGYDIISTTVQVGPGMSQSVEFSYRMPEAEPAP